VTEKLRAEVKGERVEHPGSRVTQVLFHLGIATSTWYRREERQTEKRRCGPKAKPIPQEVEEFVVAMAETNPWYGYKRIGVMCRRAGCGVKDRQAYRVMRDHGLLHRRARRKAEVHQALKLWELLPQKPNELWQMDVTYVHIPGDGWWYVVTVIDYHSRYLLSAHLTSSYCTLAVLEALEEARREAERIHGPLAKRPFLVTDNGPSFISRRFAQTIKGEYSHVRIQYRTPTQVGLVERFHQTLKVEEIYWRLYDDAGHARECIAEFRHRYNGSRPHWALIPEGGGDPLTPGEVYVEGAATAIPRWQGWAREAKAHLDRLLGEEAA
jgi:transposase InsO family protein